jgi:hypothetical protein
MKQWLGRFLGACAAAAMLLVGTEAAKAQITPAEGYTPPDDTPTVKVGGTIFADYTYQLLPTGKDADGNVIHPNAFNISRAYINVTGQISHLISFRITPDVVRVGTIPGADGKPVSVPGVSGTLTYRLKYAYGQLNLDDLANTEFSKVGQWHGSWIRLGMQQTPYVDFQETIYRYRFQGTIFVDREGFLTSSDLGASAHLVLPGNFGDVHVGGYNGEGYTNPEANDQKAIQARLTIRPAPQIPILKGLRLTGFYDWDHYVMNARKERGVIEATFENPCVNAGISYLKAKDQASSATVAEVDAEGWSGWVTPRTNFGLEALIRYDYLKPKMSTQQRKERLIAGPAYWFPVKGNVAAAILLDYEQVKYRNYAVARPKEERYAIHTLFNF